MKDLDLDLDQLPVERVLGVQWCVQFDTFKFKTTFRDRLLSSPLSVQFTILLKSLLLWFSLQRRSYKIYVERSLVGMTLHQHQLLRNGGVGCKSSVYLKTSRWIGVYNL